MYMKKQVTCSPVVLCNEQDHVRLMHLSVAGTVSHLDLGALFPFEKAVLWNKLSLLLEQEFLLPGSGGYNSHRPQWSLAAPKTQVQKETSRKLNSWCPKYKLPRTKCIVLLLPSTGTRVFWKVREIMKSRTDVMMDAELYEHNKTIGLKRVNSI